MEMIFRNRVFRESFRLNQAHCTNLSLLLKMMAVVSVYDSRYGFSDLKSVWHYEIHDLYTIVEYVSQILCDL